MLVRNLHFLLALLTVSTFATAQATEPSATAVLTVDLSRQYQHISGFGASGCWWAQLTNRWRAGLLDQALNQLFTSRGADLTIYRYNIGAGGSEKFRGSGRHAIDVETSPGVYDLSRDGIAISVLDAVCKRGVKNIVVISNSPPVRLTRNGLTSGGDNGDCNLRPGAEGELAKYLVDIADLLRRREKLARIALSPINEPQWPWGRDKRTQEGSHYSPEQAAKVIQTVLKEVDRRHVPIDVEGPELGCWGQTSPKYVQALLDDPFTVSHLKLLAIHSYFSVLADKPPLVKLAHQFAPRLNLAMTEYCQMEGGQHLDMNAGLDMAKVVYDDLTVGDATAWEWWLSVSSGYFADGLLYVSGDGQRLTASKRLPVLGQFSRFVRPGAVRVDVKTSDANLQTVAFLSADRSQVAVVIINSSLDVLPISVRGFGAEIVSQREYVTDAGRSLAALPAEQSLVSLPRSVVTVVYELKRNSRNP